MTEGEGSRCIKRFRSEFGAGRKERTSVSADKDGGEGTFSQHVIYAKLAGLAEIMSITEASGDLDRRKFVGGQESLFPFTSPYDKKEVCLQGSKECQRSRR